MYPPQIRAAGAIIYLCMQDCVTSNSKQILVAVIQKNAALNDTFNADLVSFFRLHIFGKVFP